MGKRWEQIPTGHRTSRPKRRDLNRHHSSCERRQLPNPIAEVHPEWIFILDQLKFFRATPSLDLCFSFARCLKRFCNFTPDQAIRAIFRSKSGNPGSFVLLQSGRYVARHSCVQGSPKTGRNVDIESGWFHEQDYSGCEANLKAACRR